MYMNSQKIIDISTCEKPNQQKNSTDTNVFLRTGRDEALPRLYGSPHAILSVFDFQYFT
jgi:hypothetical protein